MSKHGGPALLACPNWLDCILRCVARRSLQLRNVVSIGNVHGFDLWHHKNHVYHTCGFGCCGYSFDSMWLCWTSVTSTRVVWYFGVITCRTCRTCLPPGSFGRRLEILRAKFPSRLPFGFPFCEVKAFEVEILLQEHLLLYLLQSKASHTFLQQTIQKITNMGMKNEDNATQYVCTSSPGSYPHPMVWSPPLPQERSSLRPFFLLCNYCKQVSFVFSMNPYCFCIQSSKLYILTTALLLHIVLLTLFLGAN